MAKNNSTGKGGVMAKGILAGVLATVIAVGGTCALGYASRNENNKWFGALHWNSATQEQTAPNKPAEATAEKTNVVLSDSVSNGVKLNSVQIPAAKFAAYGVSPRAVSAYTLTIATTPENTVVTDFNWSAEFENAGSEWATGKTASDYVKITPAADNRSARIECLQAFGEPINVKCAYSGDPSILAMRKAQYIRSIENYNIISGSLNNFGSDFNANDTEVTFDVVYGVGTKNPSRDESDDHVILELSDEAYNYLTTSGTKANEYYRKWLEVNPTKTLVKQSNKVFVDTEYNNAICHLFGCQDFVNSNWGVEGFNYIQGAFQELALNKSNQIRLKISFGYSSELTDGGILGAEFYTDWYSIDDSSFTVFNSISINGDNLINGELFFGD